MCQFLNEEDSRFEFLQDVIVMKDRRIEELEEEVEQWKLKWIESTNPGIDMEMVQQGRKIYRELTNE